MSNTESSDFRCGFVAVIGRPNVGKSTLINVLVGEKVSIVTAKPQTTRHRIVAVHSTEHYQALFVDTPGIHRVAGKAMNRIMNKTAVNALADADLAVFVLEAGRYTEEDADVLEKIREANVPTVAVLNKVDKIHPKEALLAEISATMERHEFVDLVPISALRRDNLDALKPIIEKHLPVSPPLFPEEMKTDRSREFHVSEVIREKLTLGLHQELPYGISVQVERLFEEDGKFEIDAVIWVERDSQKRIVVGKGGARLKAIGREARLELKQQFGAPVHVSLWVKVKENWADNMQDLHALGIDSQ